MAKIAFLGLGAMGARMAARLLAAGHDLTVWNRTEGRAADMLAQGARWMPTPRAAADGQDIVFSMLRDDDAATEVWLGADGALDGLAEGAVGVECSTLSLPGIQRLAGAFAAAGRSFIDAPLAGSRPQAEAGSLIFLAGGEAADIEGVRPVLLAMGGALHHAGPTGAGCLAKLTVNALFGAQLAVVGELIGLIRKAGFDPAPIVAAYAETPVASPALKLAAPAMLGDAFPAAFPIDLVAKDFAMLAHSAAAAGAAMPAAAEVGRSYAAARDEGLGDLNATGIVKRYA
ncbi:MAG: NAD(P)-dependent oxidoreductase [Sphingomonadales bacterium]|nr:MAG: NAD(P)-dependent oxidoreductase [Sphingomonadales bacterium]